jgi:HD-GYP domain-containing protein (c-di-GMP phosphodiesterase class II)
MLRLSAESLLPGMIIGRTIIDSQGRSLLSAGQVLNEYYIKRIQQLNISCVDIEDQMGVEDSEAPVSDATIKQTTVELKQIFQSFTDNKKINLKSIRNQVNNIIDEMVINKNIMLGISGIKTYDDYTYQHSVNVGIISIMMGLSCGYNYSQLHNLGIGAILHDIGKINIPLEILNKPGKLTKKEYMIVQQHSWDGFKLIRDSQECSLLSAHVALQHHERVDGTGYPRGLHFDEIHEYGLITAVADTYDSLISDRPYRHGYSNFEAMEILENNCSSQLATKYVEILADHVSKYPVGSIVTLSTGDIAVITKENPNDYSTPQVKLLFDFNEKVYSLNRYIDLNNYRTIKINKIHNTATAEKYITAYYKQA